MRQEQIMIKNWELTNFKLLPSAKPPLFHGHTVRKTVSAHFWRTKLRPFILEQQGKSCSICGWAPKEKAEMRHLHLHEVEKYDFAEKVCHLIDIQLICRKCHAFHHIIRTEMVSTEKQWDDLMQHFVQVNSCSPDIIKEFHQVAAKILQVEGFHRTEPQPLRKLSRPVRYTVHSSLPFAEELEKQIRKKGLLYSP